MKKNKEKEKEKCVAVTSPVSGEDSDDKQRPAFPSVRFSSRNASSKYDFVKVSISIPDFLLYSLFICFPFLNAFCSA